MRPAGFSQKVIQTLAERAAFMCCNPICRQLTVQAHSNPGKSLRTGQGCHIRAASPGGPRYDPRQTPEQRRSIENGIWLCSTCAQVIDKDEAVHTAELLRKWKNDHEAWVANNGIVPDLPAISLTTSGGLPLPDQAGGFVSGITHANLRHHVLAIANCGQTTLQQLCGLITLPEPIRACWIGAQPPGIAVSFRPIYVRMEASGSGQVTRLKGQPITGQFEIGIERLPANSAVAIEFYTSNGEDASRYLRFVNWLPPGCSPSENEQFLRFYLQGRFQYEYRVATLSREVFAPISFDSAKRSMRIVEVRSDQGDWHPVPISGMY